MKTARLVLFVLSALALASLAAAPAAAGPTEELKVNIDQFISVLKDPKYADGAAQEEQSERIWQIIQKVFDFQGVARGAVARNWSKFKPEEQKEFSDVFAELLGTIYLNQIQKQYRDEEVQYLSEEMASNDKAQVKTKIVRDGGDIPVDYSMWQKDGAWRVYDVKIEGVSLVRNYRSQFSKILVNKPPAELIKRVKAKLEKVKAGQDDED